jgi:hypothetical protein
VALAPAPPGALVVPVLTDYRRGVLDQRQRFEQLARDRLRRVVFLAAVIRKRG